VLQRSVPGSPERLQGDCGKLTNHYLTHGITGNRDGSCQGGPFNADCYLDRDKDLQNAVGKDAAKLKNHWKDHGVKEKRIAGCATAVPPKAVAKLFKEKADYVCTAGYSQDGEPTGKRSFYETGQSDKPFSKKNSCKDIDWCIKYKTNCGQHRTCQDQLHGYTCECEAGFEVALNEEGLHVCIDILECDTQQGHANCAPYGSCEDRVESSVCKSDSGYEPTGGDTGRATCTAKECGVAPERAHSQPALHGKISFPTVVGYSCDSGYSLNAKITSGTDFPPKAVAKLFKEKADYVRTAGYSQDGEPTGKRSFYETCQSDNSVSKENSCKDIDWCIKYKTNGGQHGTCQDQLHGYTCECEAGFEVALNEEGLQVCIDILECDTQQGHANCAPYGSCEDRVESSVCKCDSGYEPTGGDTGRETCTAKECGVAPEQAHSQPALYGKISFPTVVGYS
jgi:hypothetical protein